MQVYQTDENGFFVEQVTAKQDAFGDFLIPAGCVIVAPPQVGEFKAAQFKNGAWVVVDDLRGVKYWHEGQQHEITEKGVSLPQGATLFEPPELIAAREAAEAEAAIKSDLLKIDIKSIRALREYVAAQQDAPQFIKENEAAAQTARAKLS